MEMIAMRQKRMFLLTAALVTAAVSISAQAVPPVPAAPVATPQLPPATKLEAFKPEAGSLVTFGYDDFRFGMFSGLKTDVREIRTAGGGVVRGVVVEVSESQYRTERAFVDADEIPELVRGITALLDVKANPTPFKKFEIRYETRGELRITAYNNSSNKIAYGVEVGRLLRASTTGLDSKNIEALRAMFEQAQAKLASLPNP
jgi:hypothetical protein